MKVPGLLLLVFLLFLDVSGQSSESQLEPPDLTVVKKSWRKEIHHPALTSDPFQSNDEQAELQRAQKDNNVRNAVRVREGGTPIQVNRASKPMETESQGPSTRFVYRATIKNAGTKTIIAVTWDYVFFDSEKMELLGHHSFRQPVKIRPGKSVELTGQSASPPTRVVHASKAQQPQGGVSEEVFIRRIEYEDGSFWQRPQN